MMLWRTKHNISQDPEGESRLLGEFNPFLEEASTRTNSDFKRQTRRLWSGSGAHAFAIFILLLSIIALLVADITWARASVKAMNGARTRYSKESVRSWKYN